jgi:hypothetical protein
MVNDMDEKICKNCIHFQKCVDTFRKGVQDGYYLLIEEDAYFANADGCDFYADKRIYRKVVFCKDCVYNANCGCMHSEEYDEQNYNPEYYCADGLRSEYAE